MIRLNTRERREQRKLDVAKHNLTKLDSAPWYMGLLGKVEIETHLKNKGDFAVRASPKRDPNEYIVAVKGESIVHHLSIHFNEKRGVWAFKDCTETLRNIADLIGHYKNRDVPNIKEKLRLETPSQRPAWFLNNEDIDIDWTKPLGKGNFCEVFHGKLQKKRVVAIKVCHMDENLEANEQSECQEAGMALIQEGTLMSMLLHKNIITFYGISLNFPPLMIVMECCPGGSLDKHLTNIKDKMTDGERLKIALEVAEGMQFLHSRSLIHRDLAARNCLISKNGSVKIADFGLSKMIQDLAGENMKSAQVPVRWMAPETLIAVPQYSPAADSWSYGVLMFEIFNKGIKPYPDWEPKKVATYIRRAQMDTFPDTAPKEVITFCQEGLFQKEAKARYDFTRVINEIEIMICNFPVPFPEECTVSQIPGVMAMNAEEVAVLGQHDDDVALEAKTLISKDRRRPKPKHESRESKESEERNDSHEADPPKDRKGKNRSKIKRTRGSQKRKQKKEQSTQESKDTMELTDPKLESPPPTPETTPKKKGTQRKKKPGGIHE